MGEGNGQQDNLSRLDRIEAALELTIGDHEAFRAEHEAFRAEHKLLLRSQVLLQDAQERAKDEIKATRDNLDALVNMIDRDHREFHERLKRLEGQQ